MKFVFSLLLYFMIVTHSGAQMKCASQSIQIVSKDTLTSIVESNSLGNTIETTVVDIISRYPDSDRVILQRDLISMVCETISNSTDVPFSEKSKLLLDITREIQSAFSKTSLLPFGENLLLLTRYNPSNVEFYLAMISRATIFTRCEEKGDEVVYGDGVDFSRYLRYRRSELRKIPDEFRDEAFQSGDFVLSIPKRMFFEIVDSGRNTLVYFKRIPSGNCYAADIELHLGLWLKDKPGYVANYLIRSVTHHGQCRVVIEKEETDYFYEVASKYQAFEEKHKNDWTREYYTAGVRDAHKAFEQAQAVEKPRNDGDSLTLTFSADTHHSECMNTPLKRAISLRF